jgi:hypothetical protein
VASAGRDFQVDIEACGAQVRCREFRSYGWDRIVDGSTDQQDRRPSFGWGDRSQREQARKRDQRANRPTTLADGVQCNDGPLRDSDERHLVVPVLESFHAHDVAYQIVERLPNSLDPIRARLVAINPEPLATVSTLMTIWRV